MSLPEYTMQCFPGQGRATNKERRWTAQETVSSSPTLLMLIPMGPRYISPTDIRHTGTDHELPQLHHAFGLGSVASRRKGTLADGRRRELAV